jgi:hypothetical protein
MNPNLAQRLRELHLGALEAQRQHMLIVRDSHLGWVLKNNDIEVNRLRLEIIDLIGKTIERYDQLLEALDGNDVEGEIQL